MVIGNGQTNETVICIITTVAGGKTGITTILVTLVVIIVVVVALTTIMVGIITKRMETKVKVRCLLVIQVVVATMDHTMGLALEMEV